ncbi:MAG: diaminopimelate decarboxylase [Firmicutes bacterium]|jgi:diaminopimelate decarboxylase|nr:diaminopimelate decarboxylase [Bacillota bacterium]
MKLRGAMSIGQQGHLLIGGCDTVELAQQYGTPLYVIDEAALRQKAREYSRAFSHYMPGSEVIYAGKALLTTAICRIIDEEQLSLDVVSGGELYTALAADFPPERIYFHGNNKSSSELSMAVAHGVGRIVVDNSHELELLQEIAAAKGTEVKILMRITPGVEVNTHAYIQTGQFDSKFGFPLNTAETTAAINRAARQMPNIRLVGLHCHIGSQVMDLRSFGIAAEYMVRFLGELRDTLGLELEELDLGGGLGIRYDGEDEPPEPEDYARVISQRVTAACSEIDLPIPKVMVEPGRSIVGEAGVTLYTVGAVKDIPNVRRYAAVDGGMTDNPRVTLYQAVYEACLANKAAEEPRELVTIAGKCCESGDVLIKDILLPPVEPGDILAVFSTGAYNYSMASNYNHLPKPAMITVYRGMSDIIVERETYADLVRLDRIPPRLAGSRRTAAGSVKSAAAR